MFFVVKLTLSVREKPKWKCKLKLTSTTSLRQQMLKQSYLTIEPIKALWGSWASPRWATASLEDIRYCFNIMGTEKAAYGLFKTKKQYNPILPIANELIASSPFSYKFHYMFEIYNVIKKNIDSKKGSLLVAKFLCPNQIRYCTAILALRRWKQPKPDWAIQQSHLKTLTTMQSSLYYKPILYLLKELLKNG